jgi:hypothetical protein
VFLFEGGYQLGDDFALTPHRPKTQRDLVTRLGIRAGQGNNKPYKG